MIHHLMSTCATFTRRRKRRGRERRRGSQTKPEQLVTTYMAHSPLFQLVLSHWGLQPCVVHIMLPDPFPSITLLFHPFITCHSAKCLHAHAPSVYSPVVYLGALNHSLSSSSTFGPPHTLYSTMESRKDLPPRQGLGNRDTSPRVC